MTRRGLSHPYLSKNMAIYIEKEFHHLAPAELQCALNEFYKFLEIAIKANLLQFVPVGELVDQIWHCHILQTREYFALCNGIRPGAYLHHESQPYEDYKMNFSTTDVAQEDINFLGIYAKVFGVFTESTVQHWVVPSYLKSQPGWSLSKINSFCQTLALVYNQEKVHGFAV